MCTDVDTDTNYVVCLRTNDVQIEFAALGGGWESVDAMFEYVQSSRAEIDQTFTPTCEHWYPDPRVDVTHEDNVMVWYIVNDTLYVTSVPAIMFDKFPGVVLVDEELLY
jgi:hypothetical protein